MGTARSATTSVTPSTGAGRGTAPGDPVSRIMRTPVATVDLGLAGREIADALTDNEVGVVIVEGPHGPVGLISERDLVVSLARGDEPDDVQATDLMTGDVVWASPEEPIAAVARRMLDAGVRHIPVRGEPDPQEAGHGDQPAVLGMVSVRDVLEVLLG